MTYIAHVALPEYLVIYCQKHGGTFIAHDDEVCINVDFNSLAVSRLRNNLYPYASIDVAKAKGMIPDVADTEEKNEGKRIWVRIGSKDLYKKKGTAVCETKDMVYVLTKKGREIVFEALDSIFIHFFLVGWLKELEDYRLYTLKPEMKKYIDSYLDNNGIPLDGTYYEALKKRLYRVLWRCKSVIPINSEE